MEYLPLSNRVREGDLESSPMSAAGKHVVIVGGGDTGADCLGTAVREGAASVTQLDIYAQPGADRDEDAEPWPTYPKIYRLSAAHEEARDLETAPAADADARLFAASTLRFSGDESGHVRSLHLVEVDARRQPVDGTGRTLPADLVLLALGFSGPDRGTGSSTSWSWRWSLAGRSLGTPGSRRVPSACSPPGMPPADSRSSCGRLPRGGRWRRRSIVI